VSERQPAKMRSTWYVFQVTPFSIRTKIRVYTTIAGLRCEVCYCVPIRDGGFPLLFFGFHATLYIRRFIRGSHVTMRLYRFTNCGNSLTGPKSGAVREWLFLNLLSHFK
jgi:hypothetical protein